MHTVTVTSPAGHAAPVTVTADVSGIFNYAIDQGHHFFSGLIPPGTYSVRGHGDGPGQRHRLVPRLPEGQRAAAAYAGRPARGVSREDARDRGACRAKTASLPGPPQVLLP